MEQEVTQIDWSADENKGVIYRDRAPTADDYREAISDLQDALTVIETGDESKGCAVCYDSGHGVRSCHHNPLEAARAWVREQSKWRCFHCGYVALSEEQAIAHFGQRETEIAACLTPALADENAALREALRIICIEAERENGNWTHLKRCIAVHARQALAVPHD